MKSPIIRNIDTPVDKKKYDKNFKKIFTDRGANTSQQMSKLRKLTGRKSSIEDSDK